MPRVSSLSVSTARCSRRVSVAIVGSIAYAMAIGSGRSKPASLVSVAQNAATTALIATQNSPSSEVPCSSSARAGLDDRVVARDVPADELDRQAGGEYEIDGVRVGPHVVLGDGVHVAHVIGDGTHHHHALQPVDE